MTVRLDAALAETYATVALASVRREYPYAMQRLMRSADDRPLPAEAHPMFHGSYDWHSSVHMHASLLRLVQLAPELPSRAAIEAHVDARFVGEHAAHELAHLALNPTFERPYGWAWLMRLDDTLAESPIAAAPRWRAVLAPLVATVRARWLAHLAGPNAAPNAHRAGTHTNSAFAMRFALAHARRNGDAAFADALVDAARRWFVADRRYPARYEPSGNDFLSPGLCAATLLADTLSPTAFRLWWRGYEPPEDELAHWLKPVAVGPRDDAQLVHADGLNLSRAWCLGLLAAHVPARRDAFRAAREAHLAAALPHVTGGDFVATHWLVSFALLALVEGPGESPDAG